MSVRFNLAEGGSQLPPILQRQLVVDLHLPINPTVQCKNCVGATPITCGVGVTLVFTGSQESSPVDAVLRNFRVVRSAAQVLLCHWGRRQYNLSNALLT